MNARTQARCRQCGNSSGGLQGAVNQFGESYGSQGGIITIPDFGPNPVVQIAGDGVNGATENQIPYRVIQDPNDPYSFTIRWAAEQVGRSLVAADGVTVLYTAPAESDLVINGASQQGTPTTVGGLTTTPSGPAGHAPTIVLALDTENPPPFFVNDDGEIEASEGTTNPGDPLANCLRFWPDEVSIDELEANPGAYQIDGLRTFVCVTDDLSGTQSTFIVQNDMQGNPQEHHIA